jgi:hypothetical protein
MLLVEKHITQKDKLDGELHMISVKASGSFKNTETFLNRSKNFTLRQLDKYGREGVAALATATPVDTGKTAASWDYRIEKRDDRVTITWINSNVVDGNCIAILLQYGHGTGNGGYVVGRDYINPALRPIFDRIAKSAWSEVTNS